MIPRISKILKGKRILEVKTYTNGGMEANDKKDCEVDTGKVYIECEDGTIIKCWNSEWGGIEVIDKNDSDYLMLNDRRFR